MVDYRIGSLLNYYEEFVRSALESTRSDAESAHLRHALHLIPQLRVFLNAGRREKVLWWLGWIQGICCAYGLFTIAQCAEHHTPDMDVDVIGRELGTCGHMSDILRVGRVTIVVCPDCGVVRP